MIHQTASKEDKKLYPRNKYIVDIKNGDDLSGPQC